MQTSAQKANLGLKSATAKLELAFTWPEWDALTAAAQEDECPVEAWARSVLLDNLPVYEGWTPVTHRSLTHGLCVHLRSGADEIEGKFFYHDDNTFRRFGDATKPADVTPTHFRPAV